MMVIDLGEFLHEEIAESRAEMYTQEFEKLS